MGRYAQWDLLTGRYPKVADTWQNDKANSYFIGPAEDELDARLSARFTTPFSPAPGLIVDLTIDLAYVKMRHFSKEVKPIADRIENIIEGLIAGTTLLGSTNAPTGNSAWVSDTYHGAFGPDDELNWRPDSDKLDDADADRS